MKPGLLLYSTSTGFGIVAVFLLLQVMKPVNRSTHVTHTHSAGEPIQFERMPDKFIAVALPDKVHSG